MNETPTPPVTHSLKCPHCGKPVRGKAGKKRKSDAAEWRDPLVVAQAVEAGRRLRLLREQMGLTLQEMGRMSRTSAAAVTDVEKGEPKDVCYSMLMAAALGINYGRLYCTPGAWEKLFAERDPLVVRMRKEIKERLHSCTPL